ncbi:MAG: putative exported protein [Pseudobdellovibrio sp.]|jgi:hypothetical protein|nr:putative exported protein [Pseudobdellovibrio sp.]
MIRLLLIVLFSVGSFASAYEFNWNIFMTTAATQNDKPILKDDGTGKNFDVSRYSKYAISASSVLNENWESIVNLVFKQSTTGYSNPVDLALLSYKDANNVSVFRVGRQRVATWLISDHMNVGILYPWVRPPEEVYSLNPINSLNTVNYAHLGTIGDAKVKAELYAGGGEGQFLVNGVQEAKSTRDIQMVGVVTTYETNSMLLRASYNKVNAAFRIDAKQVVNLGPGVNPELTFPVDFDLGSFEFWSVGLKKSSGTVWMLAEYASEIAERTLNVRRSGYITLGYDVSDKMKLHLTRSQLFENEFDSNGVFRNAIGKQYSLTAGSNYFISDNIVFKVEATMTTYTDGGYAMSSNLNNPAAVPGVAGEPDTVQTYAVSVDASF